VRSTDAPKTQPTINVSIQPERYASPSLNLNLLAVFGW